MRLFTEKEINEYLNYLDKNVLSLQEALGMCFICGKSLDEVELPDGPEKKAVCLKDRDYFIESFKEFEYDNSKVPCEPEFFKKDESGLIPGEIILLDWCNGKNAEKKVPRYFNNYAVDNKLWSIKKLLNKKYLIFGNYNEQLNSLKVSKLQEILKKNKIKATGRKKELIQRILDNQIHVLDIPKVYKLTNEGKQLIEYNDHIIAAHKDKYFPVYMAIRYREQFPYPTRYEVLKLSVLDIQIEECFRKKDFFWLSEYLKIKGKHLEDYNQDYNQSLIYTIGLTLDKLYGITRKCSYGTTRFDYDDIERLITKGYINKKQFDYLFDQALILFNSYGFDLELIDSDEIEYIRNIIYNIDYINTQKYIEKYISAEFLIENSSDNHYMVVSSIRK